MVSAEITPTMVTLGEIESFCDHLGAQQDLIVAALEGRQRYFMGAAPAHGITVHPYGFIGREFDGKLLLDFFRSKPAIVDLAGHAVRA